MAEPRRAWMKLTPDSDSATPKTYSTHSETPRSETFFSFVWLCCIKKIKLLLPSDLEYFIGRVSVKFKVMVKAYIIRKQFLSSLSYGITNHIALFL